MLGANYLIDEARELFGLDEVLQQTIIKQCNNFVNNLQCFDSKLCIDCTLVYKKDTWEQNFRYFNNFRAVCLL